MKNKSILILLFCLLTFTILQSQNEWNFGLNIGSTYSGIRGNDLAEENKYAIDFLAGISFEYLFNENTSLKANVYYEQKSYSQDIDFLLFIDLDDLGVLVNSKVRSTLSYLSIPIMFKYNFGSQNSFFVNGGPFISFFLDSGQKVDGEKVDAPETDFNGNDLFKSTDYGISIGIGKKIILNATNSLNIELRDNFGLSNISAVKTINNGSLKTNALNLIVNWEFSL